MDSFLLLDAFYAQYPEPAQESDVVRDEEIALLKLASAERKERRSLFFAAMRRPEMIWLRRALKHLRDDQGIDWRKIKEIDLDPPVENWTCWTMRTDKFVTILLDPIRYEGIGDFMTVQHHDELDPYCECYYCYGATIEKRRIA